jgi:ATP-dependent Clp protease ATP-binding subunit ClpX
MYNDKSNKDILEDFNKDVHGHEDAKKSIINLVNKSRLRYLRRFKAMDSEYKIIEPSKILLIAESGQGKTHLIDVASNIMRFPLLKIDACSLSPTGATSGITASKLKKMIIAKADTLVGTHKIYQTREGVIEQFVVFIDEIDKLAKPSDSSGRWNIHVQENFLTLFDDKDTFSGVSFVFAGAFTGIETQQKSKNIGFTHESEAVEDLTDWSEAVIKFGLIPELVGRLNNIHRLKPLAKCDYKRILLDLLLPKKINELIHYNCIDFHLNPEQIESIVNKAFKSGQGARALKRELNSIVQDIEFNYEDKINTDEQKRLEYLDARYLKQNKE